MKHTKADVIFEVVGGLGNQLFGLSAAAYFQEMHKKQSRISLREVDKGITAHGVSISNLELPFVMIEMSSRKRILTTLTRRVIFKIDRMLRSGNFFSEKILRVYRSDVTGYDEFLETNLSVRRIQGYFQSYTYAQSLKCRPEITPFNLRHESAWLSGMKLKAFANKPIILHIRRGDYRNQMNNFGMLSLKYYDNAVSLLRKSFPTNPIWIFTDELIPTQIEFSNCEWGNLQWISPPDTVSAEESFVLMQYGVAHIISNSTFSWWAAYASNTSSVVVAPEPWMKKIKEPETLIPPNWIRLESVWA